jgi:hypothetical protein
MMIEMSTVTMVVEADIVDAPESLGPLPRFITKTRFTVAV